VLTTHENLLSSAKYLAEIWRFRMDDVLLHALPIYHAHGLLTSINAIVVGGGSILLLPSFDLPSVSTALAQATMMMGVPTQYARLVEDPAFPNAIGKNFSWLSLAQHRYPLPLQKNSIT
jgi:malonyl-CoA/methylmalonyl-CoA synthetase